MKVILQRSGPASVRVDGEVTGSIQKGYVLLVGVTHSDTEEDATYIARKVANLRLWEDEDGKMNHSLLEQAEPLWEFLNEQLKKEGLSVQTGIFGAMMDVELVNDGPVTIIVDSK